MWKARGENWREIIVESDSKLCIDSILDHSGCPQWAISSVVSDIRLGANSFVSCLFFFWVKRSGNAAAHEAAKYTLLSSFSFSSGPSNLPASMALACKEDALAVFVSSCLWNIYCRLSKKKKKKRKLWKEYWVGIEV